MNLRLGKRVADYVIEFRTLSADSGWNSSFLYDAFLHSQSTSVNFYGPENLDTLIALTIKIDKRIIVIERDPDGVPLVQLAKSAGTRLLRDIVPSFLSVLSPESTDQFWSGTELSAFRETFSV